jgi:hypothetical protein
MPYAAGEASAALTITSNAPTSPDTVALSGSGIAVTPPPSAHTLTVELEGGGGGSVKGGGGAISCPSACSHTFADGTAVTLTASPASDSTFAGWSGGGCSSARTCQLTIGADTALRASFRPLAGPRLRIDKARKRTGRSGLRIAVRGTIATAARGAVSVKARFHVHGRWVAVSRRAKIVDGSWRTRLTLAVAADPSSAIYLSARFGGSSGVKPGHDERRLRLR